MSNKAKIKELPDNIEIPMCPKEFSEKDIKIALANYKNFIAKERKRLNLN